MSAELGRIPDNIKFTVYGYSKNIEKLLEQEIPNEIIDLCLVYYYEQDEWDKECIGDCMLLKGNSITLMETTNNTAFTKTIISEGQHYWKFKIEKWMNINYDLNDFIIGIHKLKCQDPRIVKNTYFTLNYTLVLNDMTRICQGKILHLKRELTETTSQTQSILAMFQ